MDVKDLKIYTLVAGSCLLGATLGLTLLKGCVHEGSPAPGPAPTERKVKTIYDTAFIDMPVARDSVVVRYVAARLPAKNSLDGISEVKNPGDGSIRSEGICISAAGRDSVAVEIPITQKEYADSTYRAWVSGYMANLDSIQIYNHTEIITETITREKRRKWGLTIGPSAGAGWDGRKLTPYVGIGITWGYRIGN